ncbi:hypothetical protein C9374_008064 [Naegleria lovaniensis]|uniref:RGS domain-containing protein n=1 Tax=Naegleria lovaniensis TaxID=51637 RepID=A0AA88GKL4_NAELO|nr:uncharacterized protein C9374_008064 [Naegleria lovaniensis]KAG2378916.1 hypothetical protein C9374_008064 [Naegleria lovaniensis]
MSSTSPPNERALASNNNDHGTATTTTTTSLPQFRIRRSAFKSQQHPHHVLTSSSLNPTTTTTNTSIPTRGGIYPSSSAPSTVLNGSPSLWQDEEQSHGKQQQLSSSLPSTTSSIITNDEEDSSSNTIRTRTTRTTTTIVPPSNPSCQTPITTITTTPIVKSMALRDSSTKLYSFIHVLPNIITSTTTTATTSTATTTTTTTTTMDDRNLFNVCHHCGDILDYFLSHVETSRNDDPHHEEEKGNPVSCGDVNHKTWDENLSSENQSRCEILSCCYKCLSSNHECPVCEKSLENNIVKVPWTLHLDSTRNDSLLKQYQELIGRCSQCHEYVKRVNFEKHVQNDCKTEIETNFEEIQQQRIEALHHEYSLKIVAANERVKKLESNRKELTSQKMNLQNEISDLAKKRFMEEHSQIVTLDVGGEIMQTSLSTLLNREFEPESLLATMFENASNQDTEHYIDCDPEHFSHILHWLRYGNIRVDTPTGKLLVDVAEEFGLRNLKQQIESCELLKETMSKFGLSKTNKTYNKIKQYEMDHLLNYSMKENVQLLLTNVDLRGVSLRDVQITNGVITDSDFSGLNLMGSSFCGTNLNGCNFEKCNLTNVNLSGCNLTNVNFRNATLTNASLTGSILDGCILENCNLSNANLKACDLTTCSHSSTGYILANAKLNRAIVNADFLRKSKSLFGIDLSGCSLKKMDFSGLDFSYANLSNCILTQSNFTQTNLANANLSTSSLSECLFTKCNITGAKLMNSSLRNCDLTSIDPASVGYCVAGAKLQGAKYDDDFMNKAIKLVRNKKESYARRNQSQENDLETLMLSDAYFYSILKVFAEKEYACENLLLWEKIKNLSSDFNNLQAVVSKDVLQEIYNEYVRPSAPNEINFSSDCKKKFYSLIEPNSDPKHASLASTRESLIHVAEPIAENSEMVKKHNEEVNVKSVMDLLWSELFMNIYDTFTRLQKTKQYTHWEKTSTNVPFVTSHE